MQKGKDKRTIYILMIVLQCVIYGIGNPITKIAYESVPPFTLLAFRFALAALVMIVITGKNAMTELRSARIGDWMPAALCMAGAYILNNLALNLTTATTVGFLMALPVLFVPILAIVVLRRPYRWAFLPVQLAATAGLYLLCSSGGAFHFGWGEALALIVALCVAGALVWGEKSLQNLSALTVSFAQIAITTILSITGALIFETSADLSAVQPAAWWVIVYLAILCSCLSYFLQNMALIHISSSLISLTQCTEPVFTAAAAFFILGEQLSATGWLGAAVLLACIIYGNYVEQKAHGVLQVATA